MLLAEVVEKVQQSAVGKSDLIMKMDCVTPYVREGKIGLRTLKGKEMPFMKSGISSYLSKINVPANFFSQCSPRLKEDILGEFHHITKDKGALIRLQEDNIRYIASDKYSKFDDVDVVRALTPLEGVLNIREFHQSNDTFVLRATSDEALKGLSRPFFPGIHISNSEVGRGAVKIVYFLYEQICTNGMLAARATTQISMRHFGVPTKERVEEAATKMIQGLGGFIEDSQERIYNMTKTPGDLMLEKLSSRISKDLFESTKIRIPSYQSGKPEPDSLDVLSAFTEEIQKFAWQSRMEYEQMAGDLVWA